MTNHNEMETKRVKKIKKAVLVYQGGIANVFEVTSLNLSDYGRDAKRIYQGDFRSAERICYGLALGGAVVRSAACNMAGDVQGQHWTEDLDEQPFSDKFCPQKWN